MKLNELEKKRVLILGFGREGIDSFKFLRRLFPDKIMGIADKNQKSKIKNQKLFKNAKKVKWFVGKNYLKALKNYDIIIKSPGIPIHLPEVEKAFKEGKIISQTEIFFSAFAPCKRSYGGLSVAKGYGWEKCPGKIIGITGTKGKGTTVSLIYDILKKGGVKVYLVGNIEKPALSLLAKDKRDSVYVYELSSHQLYGFKRSPDIAVFLNIYPDHLDYYKNFNEYLKAKQNIARHQKKENYFIFNPQDKNARKTAQLSKAKKIPCFASKVKQVVAIKDVPLKGKFNLLNVAAAIEVAKIFKIPKDKIKKAIKNFKSLPNRLEYVGTFKGIIFYNDSSATIPEATIEAINALGDKVETIILGGSEKNVSFKNLAARILKSKIKNLILFPTTGKKIWREIYKQTQKRGVYNYFSANNMAQAVKSAFKCTGKGKICLLSCASPSFSIFKDYKDRGDQFKKYIKKFSRF